MTTENHSAQDENPTPNPALAPDVPEPVTPESAQTEPTQSEPAAPPKQELKDENTATSATTETPAADTPQTDSPGTSSGTERSENPTPAPQAEVVTPTEVASSAEAASLTPEAGAVESTSPSSPSTSPPSTENTEPQNASSESAEKTEQAPRKLQLRPMGAESVKAVPSLGESTNTGNVPDLSSDSPAEMTGEKTDERPQPAPPHEPVAIPQKEEIDASIEAAIEAAMAGGDSPDTPVPEGAAAAIDVDTLQPGQKLKGLVQGVHGDSVFVDLGLRLTAAVPFRQFDEKKPPQVGDELEVAFEKIDETEGLILANLPRGTTVVKGGDWSSIEADQVVECVVTKTNKGGLEATVGSLRGFIPASQVELGYVADLEPYVGQKLRVRVMEVKPSKKKLVLSRKSLLAEEREIAKGKLLEELKPDQTRTGIVKTIKEYGAFVDLGGMDGFLPIAQMSWVRIGHPNEILQEGQEIEIKVLSVDREKNRVSLGMRQLAPNPWRTAEDKYAKGSTVTGRVTRVEAFGAFVELEPGVEGLVHISELEHRRVKRVQEVLNVDDMAEVQVLEVDPKKKRISLSAKALKAKPEPVAHPKDEDLAPGQGQSYQRKRKGNLKGGTGSSQGGGLFGNPTDY